MPERRAERAAGDLADRGPSPSQHGVAGAAGALALRDEADEHRGIGGDDGREPGAADEVVLVGGDDAAEARLGGNDVERQLVAVQRHARLEAQRVARGEARRDEPVRLARGEQRVPERRAASRSG